MSLPEGVTTQAGRLDTFLADHHLTKRRASSAKKKTPSTVKWPHDSPTPEDLARAGFFFKPSATSLDNVMCFVCQRQLDGWEAEDSPAREHLAHAPECGWAIVTAIREREVDLADAQQDPTSEQLMEARAATFLDSWPHEHKKGWKCKVKKLVEAGWCYDPSPEYDDGVTCFYCQLSLDGWEPKDDPRVEHKKRSPDCDFFILVEESAAARKPARGKKGRPSRASKGSRLSTQSNVTAYSDTESLLPAEDSVADVDDSVLTTATNTTTTSMAGKKRKASGKAKAPAKGGRKPTRSKKESTVDMSTQDVDNTTASDRSVMTVEPPKRATRRGTRQADNSHVENTSLLEPPSPPRRATRNKAAKSKGKARLSEDESQLLSEIQYAIENSAVSDEGTPKAGRGMKRTSDGMPKMDSSVVILDEASWKASQQPEQPKKGARKGRKKISEVKEQPPPEEVETTQETTPPAPPPKAAPQKRGRKPSKAVVQEPALPTAHQEPEPEAEGDLSMDDFPLPPSSQIVTGTPHHETTSIPTPADPSPTPSTPTPARPAPTPGRIAPFIAPKETTPSPSPQSSDAENRPPSSRPSRSSVHHPPSNRQTTRVPLATSTPTVSPSKRNIISGGLQSAFPWTAVNLEAVFLASPGAKGRGYGRTGSSDSDADKENLDAIDLKALGLEEVVKQVKKSLTSPEKKMTVEEWVYWNARRGEDHLRGECERLVGKFETEGTKALMVLEGVECAM